MAICKDPVTKEMNRRGYNLVKLARVGIEPLDVLGRDGESVEKLGSIAEVWTSPVPVPAVGAPMPAAGIDGERSSDLDIGIGLKLLANALAGLGGGISLPSLNVAFKRAKKVQFKFVNVESTSITPFALGKFLAQGTLDLANPFANQYFGNDETQEYIIFDVLKSDSIAVSAKTDAGTMVEADVAALSGALGANVKASAGSSGATEITFQGNAKATFAFKAFEVVFEDGKWTPRGLAAGEGIDFGVEAQSAADPAQRGVVIAPDRLIKLKM
jgi:hypothetical protein